MEFEHLLSGKDGNVTSTGCQVTLCHPITWHFRLIVANCYVYSIDLLKYKRSMVYSVYLLILYLTFCYIAEATIGLS